MEKIKVLSVFGTRPEAIKMAPLAMYGARFSTLGDLKSPSRTRWMASNLHLVVQMPQPTHLPVSTTVAPQPRHRWVSFLSCSSVKVPRRSLKVFLALAAAAAAGVWRGVSSNPPMPTAAVALSMAL